MSSRASCLFYRGGKKHVSLAIVNLIECYIKVRWDL